MKKMVSVIIPNYNHTAFLKKRIDSILQQTVQDFELIILDDCSTDNSKEIIELYRDHPKVSSILYNTTNTGSPFIQWKKGFDLTKGEYIWIAESDDYADSALLATAVSVFDANPSVKVVFCDSNVVDAEGNIHQDFYKKHRNKNFSTNKWDRNYIISGPGEIKDNLIFDCTINNMSATVFKKSLLAKVNFEQLNEFKYCGDWYFLIALVKQCDIAYIANPMNYFKYGTDNFKTGTKSVLNYHKERAMVRYYFWNELKESFQKKQKLYKQMGAEMRIQLNELIKGNSNLKPTLQTFVLLFKVNKSLFLTQFFYALRGYLFKDN